MDYLSYYKRATAYLSIGKTNSAIEDFSKILELKPGFRQALLQRAKLHVADGNYDLARQDLSQSQDEALVNKSHLTKKKKKTNFVISWHLLKKQRTQAQQQLVFLQVKTMNNVFITSLV